MKRANSGVLSVILAIFIAAFFVIPIDNATPSAVFADPGIMKWYIVSTPGSVQGRYDILNRHVSDGVNTGKGSEILDMSVANDGMSINTVVRDWGTTSYTNRLLHSRNAGISWSDKTPGNVFHINNAPDDPSYLLATAENFTGSGPKMILKSIDAGENWSFYFDGSGLEENETIRSLDVSVDYGGKRDVAFVTVSGTNGGRFVCRSSDSESTWQVQSNANGTAPNELGNPTSSGIDYFAVNFSPTYNGDSSVALVYADTDATYYNVAFRDLNTNATLTYAFSAPGIEVKNSTSAPGSSPNWAQLNNLGLQLPSDFSGQASSLRRAYISLDAYTFKEPGACEDGIYRIDDDITYVLMDTTSTTNKAIYSIAYFGTYDAGALQAGERNGFPCTATVPTWFTDSPTVWPIPCWYPALKPTTGASNQGNCSAGIQNGLGGAQVAWNADGWPLAMVATNSLPYTVYAGQTGFQDGVPVVSVENKARWFQMMCWDAVNNDESAFAISRNNGETWNQLSLIDTTIDWFNDVAIAPDCTNIYVATVNRNEGIGCGEFDSIWRATINPNVAAPMAAVPPLGTYWERVYTRVTAANCGLQQTDLPLLRVVPSCTDMMDGQIVGWAAQNGATANGSGVMAWSPDYGDYWANVMPKFPVQDFAFESSTTIYVLSGLGLVQRLPYTGTAWSTNLPAYDTVLSAAHTIVAVPDGKVLVGAAVGSFMEGAYSSDKGVIFTQFVDAIIGPNHGNEHVIFDVDFANNSFYYMGDDGSGTTSGTVYRNTLPPSTGSVDVMNQGNGATGILWPAGTVNPPHRVGQFGIAQAWTGGPQPTLYVAHENITYSEGTTYGSGVCRTLNPRDGIPHPGIPWACLDIFVPLSTEGVNFTLEPSSLKHCGCCTLDTSAVLYAIDDERGAVTGAVAPLTGHWNNHLNNAVVPSDPLFPGYTPSLRQGMLWAYTDCLAKNGPILNGPADNFLVGADPITGLFQQINFSWEQDCLATVYELQISKDQNFTLTVNPAVNCQGTVSTANGSILLQMDATSMTSPVAWIAPGALSEAGVTYWWRIRVYKSATSQLAWSPWSEARRFITTTPIPTPLPTPLTPLMGTGASTSHGSSVVGATTTTQTVSLPNIQIQSASLSATKVASGTPITVTANVANRGTVNGSTRIKVYINGEEDSSQGITVESGGSRPVYFTVSRSQPGTYDVYIGGTQAGTFMVEASSDSDIILWLSMACVLAALIMGAFMLWRRQSGYY